MRGPEEKPETLTLEMQRMQSFTSFYKTMSGYDGKTDEFGEEAGTGGVGRWKTNQLE